MSRREGRSRREGAVVVRPVVSVSVRALAVVLLLVRVRDVSDCEMVVLDGGAPSNLVRRETRSAMVERSVLSGGGELARAILKTSW